MVLTISGSVSGALRFVSDRRERWRFVFLQCDPRSSRCRGFHRGRYRRWQLQFHQPCTGHFLSDAYALSGPSLVISVENPSAGQDSVSISAQPTSSDFPVGYCMATRLSSSSRPDQPPNAGATIMSSLGWCARDRILANNTHSPSGSGSTQARSDSFFLASSG